MGRIHGSAKWGSTLASSSLPRLTEGEAYGEGAWFRAVSPVSFCIGDGICIVRPCTAQGVLYHAVNRWDEMLPHACRAELGLQGGVEYHSQARESLSHVRSLTCEALLGLASR